MSALVLSLSAEDRRRLELAGLIKRPLPTHIIAPSGPNFKTTPGPKQGVRYRSPYRHMAGRKP